MLSVDLTLISLFCWSKMSAQFGFGDLHSINMPPTLHLIQSEVVGGAINAWWPFLTKVVSFILYRPVQPIFSIPVPETVQKHPHFIPV